MFGSKTATRRVSYASSTRIRQQPELPRKMLYDDLAASLKQKTVDCCWTTIRTSSDRRYPSDPNPAARKFSVILREFKPRVAQKASRVYEAMDAFNAFVPWVRKIDGGIELTYVSDPNRINKVVFSIYEEETFYTLYSPVDRGTKKELIEDSDKVVFHKLSLHVNGLSNTMED